MKIVDFEGFENNTEIAMESYYASDLVVFVEENKYYVSNTTLIKTWSGYGNEFIYVGDYYIYDDEFIYVGNTNKDVVYYFEHLYD